MKYELRVIPGCPNTAPALALLRCALAAEGAAGDVRIVEVITEEQAEMLGFHGSPSFIADGRDLFPTEAPPALTCRVYRLSERLAGLPALANLQDAIHSTLTDA